MRHFKMQTFAKISLKTHRAKTMHNVVVSQSRFASYFLYAWGRSNMYVKRRQDWLSYRINCAHLGNGVYAMDIGLQFLDIA